MMKLYVLIIGFVMPSGEFVGTTAIVDSCPPFNQVISFVREQVKDNQAQFWTAECSEMDFAPVFPEKTI